MRSLTSKIIYSILGLLLIAATAKLFPFHRLTTNEKADNPLSCRYYVTLESILSNYTLLASDRANVKYIKRRLLHFEKDLKHAPDKAIATAYQNNYEVSLKKFNVSSIKDVANDGLILAIANSSYKNIDDYYLDSRLFCINQMYNEYGDAKRRITHFNLGSLYSQIPSRYMRIVAAYPNDTQLGAYSGFFVNNASTTLETQFMSGMPLLTALYVMPKYDYGILGTCRSQVPWGYFNANAFFDGLTRKVLDIAGIDVFSVLKSQLKSGNFPEFVGAKPIDTNVRGQFGGDYAVYLNTQSYGMAYLANHITYEDPHTIRHFERAIQKYFAHADKHDPYDFVAITTILYDKLMKLADKQDILLEAMPPLSNELENANTPAGTTIIHGIVGPRAWFNADCLREKCTFVLNISNATGWHAYVNGYKTPITRANFAFMAIPLPQGNSSIWFIYSPIGDLISYFVSILGLIYLVIITKRTAGSSYGK